MSCVYPPKWTCPGHLPREASKEDSWQNAQTTSIGSEGGGVAALLWAASACLSSSSPLRLCPPPQQRKPIWVACVHDLVHYLKLMTTGYIDWSLRSSPYRTDCPVRLSTSPSFHPSRSRAPHPSSPSYKKRVPKWGSNHPIFLWLFF